MTQLASKYYTADQPVLKDDPVTLAAHARGHTRIGTWELRPQRDIRGNPIGTFRRFWSGRRQSKYLPHIGKKEMRKIQDAVNDHLSQLT